LLDVLSQTTPQVVVMHAGAREHPSKAMHAFFETHAERLSLEQLPPAFCAMKGGIHRG
jgi:hypothetical protein